MFKLIVAGSRSFSDYALLSEALDQLLSDVEDEIEIVSGTASGADRLGERYALEHNYHLTKFPADWQRFGRSAGYRRNVDMANYADALAAFWDGSSKGTKHMIDIAKDKQLLVCVINF